MSYEQKKWRYQTCKIIYANNKRNKRRKELTALIVSIVAEIVKIKKRSYTPKRYWIHPLWKLRQQFGFYEAIFPTLSEDDDMFRNYMRMSLIEFEELMNKVGPIIERQELTRVPISIAARLAMTLRFLATGDCMTSTSFSYLVGFSTVTDIIQETCTAIWSVLAEEVMPGKLTQQDWLKIAAEFESEWNFDHCIGAIDGKHIMIQCPPHSGSKWWNYKDRHSMVLLAICNANYLLTFVDIGAPGRRSDGGIFKDSLMGQKFDCKEMDLPKPKKLTVDGNPMPYVLVGDEAFQLSDYLMRPFPGKNLVSKDRRVYNYRLSRARRTIENTFGIMVSKWRILKKPIEGSISNTIKIVKAIVCLHNWIRLKDCNNLYIPVEVNENELRKELEDSALVDAHLYGNHNNSSRHAMVIREEFTRYFNTEGVVPWQYDNL